MKTYSAKELSDKNKKLKAKWNTMVEDVRAKLLTLPMTEEDWTEFDRWKESGGGAAIVTNRYGNARHILNMDAKRPTTTTQWI